LNEYLIYWSGVLVCALALALPARAQVLTLDEAMRLAEAQSPRLAAQRHALSAAEEQTIRAGELPDPRLRVGIENLPVTGADRFRYDRDSMTMRAIGLMQEFPSSDKRSARSGRASRARDVERSMLFSQRALLQRDVAVAWLELQFAERSRAALERLVERLAAQADTVAAGVARGRQSAAEGFTLRGSVEQARDRVLDQERILERARYALAALLADEAKRPLGPLPELDRLAHPREVLLARLQEHPQLRVYDLREDLARAEVDVARAGKRSDWSLEVGYGHRRPDFDNMLSVMVAIDLPWQAQRRQDRDIASRLAGLEQARALREDARRMHEAELRGLLADYDAATRRLERYRAVLVPLAGERSEAALAAYRGGRGELSAVLDAQRAITETQLASIAIEADRAKAWASLSYLYPHEGAK
jgi:outer membrane protein, heavy metal efflux system